MLKVGAVFQLLLRGEIEELFADGKLTVHFLLV
jgi:hypothetical protein